MFYDIYVDLCKQKKISLSKAAETIGLSRTSVVKWKNGTVPSGATLNALARFFGVSVDFLLGNEQKENTNTEKPKLNSIARLESSEITPKEDEMIDDFIQYLLDKKKKK